jgi:DNA-binding PadR family transcriptional regulator
MAPTIESSPRRSPLAMALLALCWESPMHAYRMQQLIKERRRDAVVNVAQRNSIYQTIERLVRSDLLEVAATTRDEKRPERTVYKLTPLGRRTLDAWLRAMLAEPAREFPELLAALAFLPVLGPDKALAALLQRAQALEAQLGSLLVELHHAATFLPRILVVEGECRCAVLRAELDYVRALVADLRSGKLSWNPEELRKFAARASGLR